MFPSQNSLHYTTIIKYFNLDLSMIPEHEYDAKSMQVIRQMANNTEFPDFPLTNVLFCDYN